MENTDSDKTVDKKQDCITITRDQQTFYSDVFIFHNYSGDDTYTINGKKFLKNGEQLFKTSDFFCQQDESKNQSNVLLSRGETSDRTELWSLDEKKKLEVYNIHENAYFMGNDTFVGNCFNFSSLEYEYKNDPSPQFIDIETKKLIRSVDGVVNFFPKDEKTIMCHFKDRKIGLYDIRSKEPTKLFDSTFVSNFPDCRQIIDNYFPLYDADMKILYYSFIAGKNISSDLTLYTMEYYHGNDMAVCKDTCVALCKSDMSKYDADFQCIDIKINKTATLNCYDYGDCFVKSNVIYNGKKCNHLLYLGKNNPYYERMYIFHSLHK